MKTGDKWLIQGWLDTETKREYVMGRHWTWRRYWTQRIDLYFYKLGISFPGLLLLLFAWAVKEIAVL